MNKNAAIVEGDITKKFNPVSKVKVSNSDTGESTWIPEDSKETHSLSVIKNGIYYAASEGYTAYDTVTVNVSSETEVNYEGILADMPDLADLGLYDLDDLEGLEGLDLDLDEMLDLENLILDGDLEEGEIPESGSTIKGIDPDSGETLEVGLDEDGNLMEQVLPDHIKIVVFPAKRHYQVGDVINFSGIHVYLMKQGTTRFTCEQYPTGEIPFSELIFPVTIVDEEHITGYKKATYNGLTVNYCDANALNIAYRGMNPQSDITTIGVEIASGGTCYALFHSDYFPGMTLKTYGGYILSQEPFTFYEIREGERYGSAKSSGSKITTEHGVEYYFATAASGFTDQYNIESMFPPPTFSETVYFSRDAAEAIWLGTVEEASAEIPVQWMRTDGEILEDSFTITVGEGPDPEPDPDPYAGQCDFVWKGEKYCFNKALARSEVMYSNGTVWQTWLGGQSPPYTVEQALKLKLIVQVGWSGGGSTSGSF